MNKIYFDHSATTPTDKRVLKAMMPYFGDTFGNASSIHDFGQKAMAGVDKARGQVASFLNCDVDEVVFTSGATESDNLAVLGFLKAMQKRKKKKIHFITSVVEHDAILEPFMELEKQGIEVTYLPVKSNGVVDVEKLKKAIKSNTVFVSAMYVNSEVGAIQPIREIGKIIKKINEKKLRNWKKIGSKSKKPKPEKIYFHTDATQAVNFLDCNVKYLHVDMFSMSGHKIYGPKGIGALYVRKDTPMEAVQIGGHQEGNLRSGTYNTTGIVGLGEAVSLLSKKTVEKENKKVAKLRDMLVTGVIKNIPNVVLNTDRKNATPAHAHFSFVGVEGEAILISLDLKGIAVSTGSACASGSLKASHVLLAMGIKKEIAHSSIRFSLGKHNTETDIKRLIKVLPPIIKKLREMNPLYKK